MTCGSKISFADRWFLYFMLSNFSLRSTTRAYPTEHYSCGLLSRPTEHCAQQYLQIRQNISFVALRQYFVSPQSI